MLGYAPILKEEPNLTERQVGGLATIEQSGEHLLMLIIDLLDLAKIESGKFELAPDHVALPGFLHIIANMMRVRAEQKDLSLVLDVAPDLPSTVWMDEKRLRQVLLNLLGNAVKFTDKGHIGLCVKRLPSEEKSARLLFEVQETGVGIDRKQFKAIFQPFEQIGDLQHRLSGTGLGLSISRALIRLMGGDIHVHSQPGKGSVFWFELSLPLKEEMEAAMHALETRKITGYEGERKTILIVDETADNRAVLVDLLQGLGFQTQQAVNGKDGVKQAQAIRPDMILMDLLMPVMSGMEAIRRIGKTPLLQSTPIVMISASATVEDQAQSLVVGAAAFLTKPVDRKQLLLQIEQCLGLHWIYEEKPNKPLLPEGELVVPSPEELGNLYQAALAGNMQSIYREAEQLGNLDARYRPFSEKLHQLAKAYQSKAILEMMKHNMEHK